MKRWIAALLPILLVLTAAPKAGAASSSSAQVIDMHGAKTYLGPASDWSRSWNEDRFEEVTDEDVECDGSLTVKSGSIGNLSVVGDDSKLTVQGGTVKNVSCDGAAEIRAGT